MSREPITPHEYRRLLVIAIVVSAMLALMFWVQNRNSVRGCERANAQVVLPNARGWRIAQEARTQSYLRDRHREDLQAANEYSVIAGKLEAKARLRRSDLYPLLPL